MTSVNIVMYEFKSLDQWFSTYGPRPSGGPRRYCRWAAKSFSKNLNIIVECDCVPKKVKKRKRIIIFLLFNFYVLLSLSLDVSFKAKR